MNEKVYWMLMMIEIIFITLFLFLITWTLTFYDVFHHHWLFFSFFLHFISSIRFFVLYSHVWEKKNLIILPDVCCIYSVCVCAWTTTTTMKHAIWCVYNVSSIHRIFVLSFRSYSRFRICQPDNKWWWWWWRVRSITWILSWHKYKNHWSKIRKKKYRKDKMSYMECKMINHTQSVSTKKQKQRRITWPWPFCFSSIKYIGVTIINKKKKKSFHKAMNFPFFFLTSSSSSTLLSLFVWITIID
mgnify:CR=1 FL=1